MLDPSITGIAIRDQGLPRTYTPELYQQTCEAVLAHIEQAYPERDQSVYAGL